MHEILCYQQLRADAWHKQGIIQETRSGLYEFNAEAAIGRVFRSTESTTLVTLVMLTRAASLFKFRRHQHLPSSHNCNLI
jgi:hypothetical protein